jgi:hypothetical protein
MLAFMLKKTTYNEMEEKFIISQNKGTIISLIKNMLN